MRKQKLLSLVLTLMVLTSVLGTVAFADNSKEQLSINFTTDKKEYKQGEDVNIEINIKNTSGKDLKEVEVKNTLPKGLEIKSNPNGEKVDKNTVKWDLGELKKDDSVNLKLSSTFNEYKVVVPVPNTGTDNYNHLLVGFVLLIIASSGIIYIKKNPTKFDKTKATGVGMALVMTFGVLGKSLVIADATSSENSLNISKILKLKCDGKELDNILEVKGVFIENIEAETPEDTEIPDNDLMNPDNPKWNIDTDNDGLSDAEEEINETDPNNSDTDGDGLSDYEEIYITKTDPLKIDTNGNGVSDDEEDNDEDGISNIDEVKKYSTDPNNADTDNDGLTDSEELKYSTDPNNADTDEDGLLDGEEIILGLDPLKKKTDGITLDSNRKIDQVILKENFEEEILSKENTAIPNIKAKVEGSINLGTKITVSNNTDITDKRSLIGKPIEIIDTEKLIGSELTFEINIKNQNINDLLIFRYDEETSEFIALDTKVDVTNKMIKAQIDKLGTYFVLDARVFLEELGINIEKYTTKTKCIATSELTPESVQQNENNKYDGLTIDEILKLEGYTELPTKLGNKDIKAIKSEESKGQADIVFVIDTTGSMGRHISNVVRNINEFIDKLFNDYNVNVNLGLVEYKDITVEGEDSTIIHKYNGNEWFTNLDSFKNEVRNMIVEGGGDNDETTIDALEMARRMKFRSSSDKFVILLTDAGYKMNNRYGITNEQELIDMYKESGISLSVITTSSQKSNYSKFFEDTNGIYGNINGNFLTELLKLADKIGNDVNDGYWITLKGYKQVKLNGEPTSDRKYDTDEDGIKDYDELGKRVDQNLESILTPLLSSRGLTLEEYTGPSEIPVYEYHSDPTNKDTDGDGYTDKEEIDKGMNRRKFDITDRTLSLVSGLSYNNLSSYVGKTIGEIIDCKTTDFKNLKIEYAEILRNWKIEQANDSGKLDAETSEDLGIGSITLSSTINGKREVIYGIRGTEFEDDLINDGITDIAGGFGMTTPQSTLAIIEYNKAASIYKDANIYVTGHSLGGRVAQDVVVYTYDTISKNVKKPRNAATFNALGYGILYKIPLTFINKKIKADNCLNNYYYKYDLVGQGLGDSVAYFRVGNTVGPWDARDESGNLILGEDFDEYILLFLKRYSPSKVHGISLWHPDNKLKFSKTGSLN